MPMVNRSAVNSSASITTKIETFLEGSQKIRYAGAQPEGLPKTIDFLAVGKYYLPFSLHLPNNLPPSIPFVNFPPLFFSIKYKLCVENYVVQEVRLVEPPN